MGESSKDASIEKLCESMQRMLAQLMEQAHTKSSSVPDVLKINMEPNPVKLTGPGDYFSWARNATLILGVHGLQDFLEEDGKKPGDMSQEHWEQNKKRVMVWLLSSIEKAVREQVENLQNAAEVWKDIEKQFSGKSNKMQVSRILQEMRQIKQEKKSVTEYAGELKKLYRDLEFFRPFKPHDPRDLPLLREWFEPILVQIFLDGLNQEFHLRSQLIMATTTWPTLEETVASILEEETRMSHQATASHVSVDTRAALSSLTHVQSSIVPKGDQANETKFDYKRKPRVVCGHCKRPNHTTKDCYELVGYPPGWQRRQNNRLTIGKNRERKQDHVHFTSSTGELPSAAAQAFEEYKAKIMAATTEVPAESTSSSHAAQGVNHSFDPWIIDSGATNHMTGSPKEFSSYMPRSGKDRVRIADGSSAPIMGCGTISCTPTLPLNPVLHVPNFPVNLLSVSSITKSLNCGAWFEPKFCVFQELKSRKILGTGTEHDGLYYLDGVAAPLAFNATCTSSTDEFLLLHYRLGHLSFQALGRKFPSLFASCCKDKLGCDVCELAKHTRATYPSSSERSQNPFEVVHSDVWGPSVVTSLLGERWYVTFIDGFSRCTWLYLLKQKCDVLSAFKNFYALICNQYNAKVKIFRSDNGTEYVNQNFDDFLSSNGIVHQTTCVNTAAQNGVAERKNRHLLEVARSLMFTMNVPKFLWGEAVKTAAYLVNRMPSRVLNYKTPIECLSGANSFIVPPKVFGCTCFVHDYRNSVGKLDPRAVRCIFVGYSPTQKGYRCWCPTERRFNVSMDVTFREKEPFYSSSISTSQNIGCEGENSNKGSVSGGSVLVPMLDASQSEHGKQGEENVSTNEDINNSTDHEGCDSPTLQQVMQPPTPLSTGSRSPTLEPVPHDGTEESMVRTPAPGDPPLVYYRRRKVLNEPTHDTTEEDTETSLAAPNSPIDDCPIALRKPVRNTDIPARLKDCVGYEHDLAKFVSYEKCSSSLKGFIASLDSTSIPKDWSDAMKDPKWKAAMLEEMNALEKNNTWELVELPSDKDPVGCKWVYTIKHNPEGKVERYKARLVAKGYTQTYGVDYEETFAPVPKMNSIRALISCASNLGWDLHQLDVKNAFLHGDLQEEIYMHIPPGFNTAQTEGKVLRLHRSLYGLKQSPRAWFDRFRRAVLQMGYKQSNADHTLFYKRNMNRLAILIVYVDDIIITGDDAKEIKQLKLQLAQEFEVKDLGQLRYFLGIEVSRSSKGIYLSQRKYVLDLLSETGMTGCRLAYTPIEQNHHLVKEVGSPVDREQYQRLVGRLIYLSHTHVLILHLL